MAHQDLPGPLIYTLQAEEGGDHKVAADLGDQAKSPEQRQPGQVVLPASPRPDPTRFRPSLSGQCLSCAPAAVERHFLMARSLSIKGRTLKEEDGGKGLSQGWECIRLGGRR